MELREDLQQRREQALAQGWRGEIEGIDLTLRLLEEKIRQTTKTRANAAMNLGMPSVPTTGR
ncbi:hypothetical protein [Arthrobacter sp. ISL-95]|uniref:hypothetical protein n=1 Tax=Arthrobacter sp. ISL-95 TaxID=2819116 RepID=UPI001BEB0BA8|nr:hypothetical protein [Arthrobacter sp. ISL-95]MBT2586448.1 hypothetical protein [Arthrobacter sp. ISL-95]